MIYDIRSVVRHSILTAVAMDALGTTLAELPEADRVKWCYSDKLSFPKHPHKKPNNVGSEMSSIFTAVLSALATINPVDENDLPDTLNEIRTEFEIRESVIDQLQTESAYPLALAAAIGYYAVLSETSFRIATRLIVQIFEAFAIPESSLRGTVLFAFAVYRLVQSGYFGHQQLQEFLDESMVPESLQAFVERLMDHHLDADFLQLPFSVHYVENLNQVERAVAESFYYMSRIATAYPKKVLLATPRDQLVEVFTSDVNHPSALGFVFGAICTASEQQHPLITKQLREATELRSALDECLTYIS